MLKYNKYCLSLHKWQRKEVKMKKIICISLIMILALTLLAGCGKNANPTPLTPVFANGVSPDYSASTLAPDDNSDDTPDDSYEQGDLSVPEGYALYSDSCVSFIYPASFYETLRLYLNDADNGAFIAISEQALDPFSANFELNAYADVTQDNYTETYAAIMGSPEAYSNVTVAKTNSKGYEITVIKYFDATEEVGADEYEIIDEPRAGTADIYIEKSSDASFKEIFIKVSALEYTADTLPEDTVNFSEIVSKLTSSLNVIG